MRRYQLPRKFGRILLTCIVDKRGIFFDCLPDFVNVIVIIGQGRMNFGQGQSRMLGNDLVGAVA